MMSAPLNRQVRLKSRPVGVPQAEHFEIVTTVIPALREGQVLVRNFYLSVDPVMRGWVNASDNYSEPVAIGDVMRSFASGVIEESRHPEFLPGEWVTGLFGWQEYAAVEASAVQRKVSDRSLPLSTSLGVLGLNGVTAHYGLLEIGRPKAGETVVVSTAAGAVGSCVGQIAKLRNCRTIGIVGSATKAYLCKERFGFDAVLNYRDDDLSERLHEVCPDGIDVYFDNTAGSISDVVTSQLNVGARVVICGTASITKWEPPPTGPRVERQLLLKRASMRGFVILDHAEHYPAALRELARWIHTGEVNYLEEILDGIESAPDAIAGLYRGENLGRRLIRVVPKDLVEAIEDRSRSA